MQCILHALSNEMRASSLLAPPLPADRQSKGQNCSREAPTLSFSGPERALLFVSLSNSSHTAPTIRFSCAWQMIKGFHSCVMPLCRHSALYQNDNHILYILCSQTLNIFSVGWSWPKNWIRNLKSFKEGKSHQSLTSVQRKDDKRRHNMHIITQPHNFREKDILPIQGGKFLHGLSWIFAKTAAEHSCLLVRRRQCQIICHVVSNIRVNHSL